MGWHRKQMKSLLVDSESAEIIQSQFAERPSAKIHLDSWNIEAGHARHLDSKNVCCIPAGEARDMYLNSTVSGNRVGVSTCNNNLIRLRMFRHYPQFFL